jgi:hypothetical protein
MQIELLFDLKDGLDPKIIKEKGYNDKIISRKDNVAQFESSRRQ